MRALFVMVFVTACGFAPATVSDAHDAPPPDGPDGRPLMWTKDPASGIACPASAQEWQDFIAAKQLTIAPPDGLWLLQDPTGNLAPAIGSVQLTYSANGPITFQAPIAGWTRRGIKLVDAQGANFRSNDATLPDVTNDAMTILMYYGAGSTPPPAGQNRDLVYMGSGPSPPPAYWTRVELDSNLHFKVVAGSNVVTGTHVHTGVVPVVFKLDHAQTQQEIITNQETVGPITTPLVGNAHAIILGAGGNGDPDGSFLYLVAWYRTSGAMTDTQVHAMLAALGFP